MKIIRKFAFRFSKMKIFAGISRLYRDEQTTYKTFRICPRLSSHSVALIAGSRPAVYILQFHGLI